MVDTGLNRLIRVETYEDAGSLIRCSHTHLGRIEAMLADAGIPYWVDQHMVSINGGPMRRVIYLRLTVTPEQVQQAQTLLDAAA